VYRYDETEMLAKLMIFAYYY